MLRRSNWPRAGEIQLLSLPTPQVPAKLIATLGNEEEPFCQFVAGDFNGDGANDLALAPCDYNAHAARFIPGSEAGFDVDKAFDLPMIDGYPFLDNLFSWQSSDGTNLRDHLTMAVATPHPEAAESIVDWEVAALAKQKYATITFLSGEEVSLSETDLGERGDVWFRPRAFGSAENGRPRLLTAFSPRVYTYLEVQENGTMIETGNWKLPGDPFDPTDDSIEDGPDIMDQSTVVADLDGDARLDVLNFRDGYCHFCDRRTDATWTTSNEQGMLAQTSIFTTIGHHAVRLLHPRHLPDRIWMNAGCLVGHMPGKTTNLGIGFFGACAVVNAGCSDAYTFDYNADGIDDLALLVDWSERVLHPF